MSTIYNSAVIYKYSLALTDVQTISMPKNAKILSVQNQHEQPRIWALVSERETDVENRTFHIYGTGAPIRIPVAAGSSISTLSFIGTVQFHDGSLVFHVFEEVKS